MPTANLKQKRERARAAVEAMMPPVSAKQVARAEGRAERRAVSRVLRQCAQFDPARWPEPDYAHD